MWTVMKWNVRMPIPPCCSFFSTRWQLQHDLTFWSYWLLVDVYFILEEGSFTPLVVRLVYCGRTRSKTQYHGCWCLGYLRCQAISTVQQSAMVLTICWIRFLDTWIRADSRLAPSQWDMALQSNAVSHWLGTNLDGSLSSMRMEFIYRSSFDQAWEFSWFLLISEFLGYKKSCNQNKLCRFFIF